MSRPTPLRRELLVHFGVLFAAALFFAAVCLVSVLPLIQSAAQWATFIVVLVVADLVVLFVFGRKLLHRLLVRPTEQLAEDVRRIAGGEYDHRIHSAASLELGRIQESVNEMADRLLQDQRLLAENVSSLEQTNRELVEARDQVVHTARLASVGTLAAGIAHEVGNPLGAIVAFADVARSRAQKAGADTDLLDSIRDEAMRIDRIVRGLLDYARPKESELGPHAPAEVMGNVRRLLENQGKLDCVEDTWAIVGDVGEVVMQPHQLEQVLVNLLLNAVDALGTSREGQISVQLFEEAGPIMSLPRRRAEDPQGVDYMHRRRVSRDDGGRGIDPLFTSERVAVFRVEDNGPGIPDADLERVFDPFYTTKEPGQGTGLGLSICARLVDGMGGRISVENRDAGGAAFEIRLPVAAVASEANQPMES